MYEILFARAAERYFKKLKEKELKKTFQNKLFELRNDPYIGELKTGDLAGIYCCDVYYNKTNYEIAYKIYEEGQLVVIIFAGTRENFYDELKRYIN